jgi:hypothetical protein
MKKAMVEQWDNPARINELRMRLDTLPCKRSISEYARQYQEIEAQIPLKDMSPGDRIYKFITHLPPELYMTFIHQTEQDISYFYSAARIWEGLQKIPQKLAAVSHQGPSSSKFLRKFRPSSQSTTTMPYLSNATTSLTSDPMDLDAMSVSRDPRKPSPTVRCYNCNLFGHLARDCRKAPRRATPAPVPRERFCRVKSMHLLEEESEGEEDADGEYEPEGFDPEGNNSEEYDPQKPDLELQYLVGEANLMELKKELTKEEEQLRRRTCFRSTHAYCDYCEGCSDWSTQLPGAAKWKPGSPDHEDDDWRPNSPNEAYLEALRRWVIRRGLYNSAFGTKWKKT